MHKIMKLLFMANKLKCVLTLLLCSAFVVKSFGEKRLTGRVITTIDGLATNRVNDMVQDRDGFLWFGTSNGLCRYDGYSFLVFPTMGVGTGETNANVGTIHVDEKNQLMWLRSVTFNYACYDLLKKRFVDFTGHCDPHKTFERFFIEENGIWMYESKGGIRHVCYQNGSFSCRDYTSNDGSLPKCRIKRIRSDKAGNMWILTDNGLLRADKQGHLKLLVSGGDYMMQNCWRNQVFVLSRDGKVLVFDLNGKLLRKVLLPQGLRDMGAVNGNIVWQDKWLIMTRTAIIAMDCHRFTFDMPKDYQMEYAMQLDEYQGNFWVADKHGTLALFPSKGTVRKFPLLHESGFAITRKRNFSSIMGPEGKYYIATYGKGLFVYHPQTDKMEHYSANDRDPVIATDYLTNIHLDSNGNIWVGQEDAGIVCLTESRLPKMGHISPDSAHPGMKTNYITHLKQRPDGKVMVNTQSCDFYLFDPNNQTIVPTSNPGANSVAMDSLTDSRGRTWIATWEQGLIMVEKAENGQLHTTSFLTRSISESRINALTIDKQGILWAATYNGIYAIDAKTPRIDENRFMHWSVAEGLPSNSIFCIHASADGYIWAGGLGTGVIKMDYRADGQSEITTISTKQGLNSNNIRSLVKDHRGYVWAATDDGISMVNPKNNRVINYQVGTTLLREIYSDGCALTLSNTGTLLFGTHDGITTLMPGDDRLDSVKAKAAIITDVDINGKSVFHDEQYANMRQLDKQISLAHHENSLTLHFSCFDYCHSGRTMYQFYLEGFDSDWREPTTQHSVDYGSLPPGRYLFHLRAGEDGAEATLSIIIRQPWYNTWWAWLLYIIIIGVGAYIFYSQKRERFKMRQQILFEQQVSEFRTNFFTQVAHEFRTPMAIISGAVDKLEESGSSQRKPIQTAKRGVRRLSQLVNQLMEFRKINTGNLRLQVEQGEIVGFVRNIYQDFWNAVQQKELQTDFMTSDKRYDMVFDHHIMDTITYNLLSNAVKYTPQGGRIHVQLSIAEGNVVFVVEDSGPGIDENRLQQLFKPFMHGFASQGGMGIGLYTAHQMALTHKGSLTYERSETLGGSRFILVIPVTESVYDAADYKQAVAVDSTRKHESYADQIIKEMLPKALNDKTIVIIEDNPDMLEQIKSEVGVYFNVVGYTDGKMGYEAMHTTPPTLLLCDVMLPDINGYDIVKQMRADEQLKHVPVIMLTALDDEKHQIKGYTAGADDYMVKPCNYRILIARAIQLIKWREEHLQNVVQPVNATKPADNDESSTASTLITSQADKRFLDKVNVIMSQNLGNAYFSIDMMAEQMHMGRTKLYGKVKELTGMSPNKLFVTERMRVAAKLLEEGDLNISEIAYKVGFPEASYFNKCFKQYYGVAPSKYRKEN